MTSTVSARKLSSSATKIVVVALCAIALSGCLRPYRMDVQQGNVVTQDMVAKLKPGMSQREVRFVLGSPMIEDPFHAERWDYAYSMKQGRDPNVERAIVTVLFENGKLSKVVGDANTNIKDERMELTTPQIVDPSKTKKKSNSPAGIWERLKNTVSRKKK